MRSSNLVLLLVAGLLAAGCVSNESKPEAAPAPVPVAAAEPAPVVASKPKCEPPAKASKKSSKKADKAPAPDCEPAAPAKVAAAPAAAAPAPAPVAAKDPVAKAPEPGKPRVVKSRDGTFEGEVYGNIPAGSKWARLQIGMEQPEVERILGTSQEVRAYATGKAFIPFYHGTDAHRYEVVYRGQGSVSYTGGSWGGGRGVLMMINYDPKI